MMNKDDKDINDNSINEKVVENAIDVENTDNMNAFESEENKPIFLPLIGLIFIVCINFLVGVLLMCNAVILYQDNLLLIAAIAAFLLVKFIGIVDKIYLEKFKWRKWLFYLLYYGTYFLIYLLAFNYFMRYIQSDESIQNYFIYTAFGATLVYTFGNFQMIIIFQFAVKFLRRVVLIAIDVVKGVQIKNYNEVVKLGKDSSEEVKYYDILTNVEKKIKDRRIRYYLFNRISQLVYKSKNRNKLKEEKSKSKYSKSKKDKMVFIPLVLLVILSVANLYIGIGVLCNMVIFAPQFNRVMLILILLYLFLYFMHYVDKLYFEKFRWRKWIFYLLFYSVQIGVYIYLESNFNTNIKDNMQNYFASQEAGAAYSYIIQNYFFVIFIQIFVKVVRAIVIYCVAKVEFLTRLYNKVLDFMSEFKNNFVSDKDVEEYINEIETDDNTTAMIKLVLDERSH